jgi:hypothetical protein
MSRLAVHHRRADHPRSGRTSFSLPPIARVDEAILTPMQVHRLDDEVLFDCDLSAQRIPVGRAKKST